MAVTAARAREEPRRVSILGATGSVGCSTIDLLERQRDAYRIEAITAQNNAERLIEQAWRLRPQLAVIGNAALYPEVKSALAGSGIAVAAGRAAVIEAAARPADWIMAAIVGAAGLEPTLAALEQGAMVGLANKETLVCAGVLVMRAAARHGARLLPVDSEHSAIFQVFDFERIEAIEKIILTASGGPFRDRSAAEMVAATPEAAVAHPNWSMGAKISVDSATMMNKGLELIEAHHLFGLPSARIEILVHPQSIIHSMVAYRDGSVLAQLGSPDMRTPIAYALGWPQRIAAPSERLDFAKIARLTFEAPDESRFPALRLARAALEQGGAAPAVLNAANEVAVSAFLARRIGFAEIARIVEASLDACRLPAPASIADVLAIDACARDTAAAAIARKAS